MKRIILITIIILSLCSSLLLSKTTDDELADRIMNSQTFIAIQKLDKEFFDNHFAMSHAKRDSILRERAKHVFDYPFLKQYPFLKRDTLLQLNLLSKTKKQLFKEYFGKRMPLFSKLNLEFSELKTLSRQSRIYVYKKIYYSSSKSFLAK